MIGTVIDIETTGYLSFSDVSGKSVLSDQSEILEVGYINIDMNTKDILTYGTLYFYKPYFNVESEAQKVHGLTRDFLQKYENDFEKNLIALNSLIQCTCIIGKNSDKFDIPFIKAFINKHGGIKFDMENLVFNLNMKSYQGGKVVYEDSLYATDLQTYYKERFHRLYAEKYSYLLGKGQDAEANLRAFNDRFGVATTPEMIAAIMPTHQVLESQGRTQNMYPIPDRPFLPNTKKGTLSQYVDVIPNGQMIVDYFYNKFDKDRVTGAHGALYDAVMTYVVWADAMNNDLL